MITKFVFRLFVFTVPFVVLAVCAWVCIFVHTSTATQAILHHQLDKLESNSDFETILVGDSSLGNSIDARAFSDKTGSPTINLALNGLYSYAGSYHLLRRAIAASPSLRNVVIVHALDSFLRPVATEGYVRSLDPSTFYQLPADEWLELPDQVFGTLLSGNGLDAIKHHLRQRPFPQIRNDYVEQGEPPAWQLEPVVPMEAHQIQLGKLLYLEKLVELARAHDLKVIYTHGPCRAKKVEQSEEYITAANQLISTLEIHLIDNIVALDDASLGDSYDHVRPDIRPATTAKYADLLGPALIR